MKVYLCGITQNQKKNIDDLTRDCYKAFDGLIYVDGGSTDGTKELLEDGLTIMTFK
jgi:glycosyltransferase involved in cell wall biosynthesis